MTVVLKITDGTTTVDLMGSTFTPGPTHYVPKSVTYYPSRSGRVTGQVVNELASNDTTITETLQVWTKTSSIDTVITSIRSIETLLTQAAEYQESKRGSKVYVQFRPNDTGNIYQCEILRGRIDWDEETLNWQIPAGVAQFTILLTRRSFWEDVNETGISLLSVATTPKTTNAVTIHNHTDSGHGNYVDIAAADVAGVVPAPVRLALVNSTASNQDFIIYIAHAWNGTPASVPSFLEGENGTATGTMTNTPTVDTDCSNGNKGALSWTGDDYAGIKWSLTAAQIQAIAGGNVHFLGRFEALPSGTILAKLELYLPSGTTAIYSQPAEQVATLSTTHYLQDFGSMRIPPSLLGVATLGALDLRLSFKKTGGGSLALDFLSLMPCDSFKCLKAIATGAVNTDTIMIDETTGDTYIQASGGTRTGQLVSFGSPIMLMPGKRQFLWFLVENNVPGMEIDRSHTLQAFYRPRRLTI